ncbi:Uncharacterised protein [Serratia ficaria]|uniref:helix-turn-helix transcriptional regulator n=1 Tax=Serratia ficaria TaxID=61651 RepID=UPI00217828F1|nr:hypothetical protein [Serratia ficaria]CAI2091777.1 Uncharacterised protein [Serratia ficaria]CAI2463384.1 Uncharacterised protein [Serratia ficaria]
MNPCRSLEKESIFIVLTDNFYLYNGLAGLVSGREILHVDLGADEGIPSISCNKHVVILIDGLVFLSGNWAGFHSLASKYPAATMVWLTREETGHIFPCGREGEVLLAQKSHPSLIRFFMQQIITLPEVFSAVLGVVRPFILTPTEKDIFFSLVYGGSVLQLARKRKKTRKTIYSHQRSVVTKSGFKSVEFLRYVISYNKSVFNAKWWWIHVCKR